VIASDFIEVQKSQKMLPDFKSRFDGKFLTDVVIAAGILAVTSIFSVAIGFQLNEGQLGSWGSWLGSFIAGIALVASGYALVVQARHGESTSWNIALGRLGAIYDLAYKDPRLAKFLTEKSDPQGKVHISHDDLEVTAQERVWFGNLFLAYEQIFVATLALSAESRRVWRIYLKNQLNKPTIRALFVADAGSASDYHAEFYRFVREKEFFGPRQNPQRGFIKESFFECEEEPAKPKQPADRALVTRAFVASDADFWMQLYSDPEVRKQMYSAPTDSTDSLVAHLSARKVFTVWLGETRVGGFTITPEKDRLGTFGIVVEASHRGKGLSTEIMRLMEREACALGALTLRGDVYADNAPSIKALENAGFRKFLWFEKNIA
jgi:RimJ/RimL family protein N-acetyltransferase